jgi:hypothetical protein
MAEANTLGSGCERLPLLSIRGWKPPAIGDDPRLEGGASQLGQFPKPIPTCFGVTGRWGTIASKSEVWMIEYGSPA